MKNSDIYKVINEENGKVFFFSSLQRAVNFMERYEKAFPNYTLKLK